MAKKAQINTTPSPPPGYKFQHLGGDQFTLVKEVDQAISSTDSIISGTVNAFNVSLGKIEHHLITSPSTTDQKFILDELSELKNKISELVPQLD